MRADKSSAGTAIDLIGFVTRHLACAQCGSAYAPADVRVTQRDRDEWLLTATCPVCGDPRAITAYDGPPYLRLGNQAGSLFSPLTARDVVEWRAFLARFEGNMVDLLAER